MTTAVLGTTVFFSWEVALMEWLQSVLPGWSVPVISALSVFGEDLLLVAVTGFLYWSYNKELGKTVGLSMLSVNVWCPMIKNIFLRLRPYFVSDKINLLRKIDSSAEITDVAAQGYSFPSGHSANAVSVYGTFAAYIKKKWALIPALLLPLLVGFSRVAVGAHFPTDVFAGWGIGVIAMILIPFFRNKFNNKWIFSIILLVLALPGFFFCTSTDFFSGYGMLLGFALAEPFEEKFVNFENTRSPIRAILRVLVGGALYFGLNTALKLPFPSAFLSSGTFAANLVRMARYAVVIFIVIGVYPMLFKVTAKIGKKKTEQTVQAEQTEQTEDA